MTGRIIGTGDKTRYVLDGVDVTKEEFDKAFPDKPIRHGDDFAVGWKKPVLSDALAVHPAQVKAAMERDKKAGVPTEYTEDGRPILTSQAHKRKLLRSFGPDVGMHENNCYS